MKKVAGPLKLELAEYRALEAFAKFGSDLDKATQQQLLRGARLIEVMKQAQYSPVPVEEQVITIYSATKGYMDKLPLTAIKQFENELIAYVKASHPELIQKLKEDKALTDEIVGLLKNVLDTFTERFVATVAA